MPVRLRVAVVADAESIAENIKTANTAAEIREQIALFQEQGVWHLVAEDEGRIVGNAVLLPSRYFPPNQAHRGELADFVVSPSHQGTGLARRLVERVVEEAVARGMRQLEVACEEGNAHAAAAYPALGFHEWGR